MVSQFLKIWILKYKELIITHKLLELIVTTQTHTHILRIKILYKSVK